MLPLFLINIVIVFVCSCKRVISSDFLCGRRRWRHHGWRRGRTTEVGQCHYRYRQGRRSWCTRDGREVQFFRDNLESFELYDVTHMVHICTTVRILCIFSLCSICWRFLPIPYLLCPSFQYLLKRYSWIFHRVVDTLYADFDAGKVLFKPTKVIFIGRYCFLHAVLNPSPNWCLVCNMDRHLSNDRIPLPSHGNIVLLDTLYFWMNVCFLPFFLPSFLPFFLPSFISSFISSFIFFIHSFFLFFLARFLSNSLPFLPLSFLVFFHSVIFISFDSFFFFFHFFSFLLTTFPPPPPMPNTVLSYDG